MVTLKSSFDAWDQVDAVIRKALDSYSSALEVIENQIVQPAVERFGATPINFQHQRDALARRDILKESDLPTLDAVSCEVEESLKALGRALRENGCPAEELQETSNALRLAISSIFEIGASQEKGMRNAAGQLEAAAECDNLMTLRIRIRYQARELIRLADEVRRDNAVVLNGLETQVTTLSAKLLTARDQARRDALTGILNRRGLQEVLSDKEKQIGPKCLLMLDVDQFKSVNDRYGYVAGDELLRQIAQRIQKVVGPEAAASRWGGDEFVIVIDGALPDGMRFAQSLDRQLRDIYRLDDGKASAVRVQASIGTSEWKEGEHVDAVLKRADWALKARKGESRGSSPTGGVR
jgi:diguanylate cyclase (GGDEF)-like protein